MAIKTQEKNFLIGMAVFGLIVGLLVILLPLLSDGSKSNTKEAPPNRENVRVEIDKKEPVPEKEEKKKPANQKETKKPQKPKQKKTPEPAPKKATMVLSKAAKLPTDYFEDSSGVAELPRVVERYLEAVKNGSRFMGRLESIALRDNKSLEEQRQSAEKGKGLQIQRGDITHVISYNMKLKTPFLSASFDAAAIDDFKGDVLVEWVDSKSNERIELFFTPLSRSGETGMFRLSMPQDSIPPASEVFVYSATDEMPLIANGVYLPD